MAQRAAVPITAYARNLQTTAASVSMATLSSRRPTAQKTAIAPVIHTLATQLDKNASRLPTQTAARRPIAAADDAKGVCFHTRQLLNCCRDSCTTLKEPKEVSNCLLGRPGLLTAATGGFTKCSLCKVMPAYQVSVMNGCRRRRSYWEASPQSSAHKETEGLPFNGLRSSRTMSAGSY